MWPDIVISLFRCGCDFLEQVDEAEWWVIVIVFGLTHLFFEAITKDQWNRPGGAWIHAATAVSGLTYLVYAFRTRMPYGVDHVTIGFRALFVGLSARHLAAFLFFMFREIYRVWQVLFYRIERSVLLPIRTILQSKQHDDPEPEVVEAPPTQEELDERFEKRMNEIRKKFSRRCHVINQQPHLNNLERDAAVMKARAKMSNEINQAMEQFE